MLEGPFQPTHLLAIFAIALLVFGPKKLPEPGKGIGEGIRGFKSAMKERKRSRPTSDPSSRETKADRRSQNIRQVRPRHFRRSQRRNLFFEEI